MRRILSYVIVAVTVCTFACNPAPASLADRCDEGDANSCFLIGVKATESDDLQGAVAAYKKACTHGHGEACYRAGLIMSTDPVGQRDEMAAEQALRPQCDTGDARACAALGNMYLDHKTGEMDAKARTLYQKAVLAALFVEGRGGAADEGRGQALLKKQCDVGHVLSCEALKFMGKPVEADTRNVAVNVVGPDSKLAMFDARGRFVSFVMPNDSDDGWKRPTDCVILDDLRAIELGTGSTAPCYLDRSMLYFERPGCAGDPFHMWLSIIKSRGQLYRKSGERVSYTAHSILGVTEKECLDIPKPMPQVGYRLKPMHGSAMNLPNPPYEVRKVGANWSPEGYETSPD